MTDPITSRRSQIAKKVRRLKKKTFRDRDGLFLVEGLRATREAFARGQGVESFLFVEGCEEKANLISSGYPGGVERYQVSESLMDDLSATVNNQGIMALVKHLDVTLDLLEEGQFSLVLVLGRIRDPGNMGALIRVADASGADCVVVSTESVDIYNPKAVRASAGSIFHIPMVRDVDFASAMNKLREMGLKTLVLDSHGGSSHYDENMSVPVVLVVGNEARGFTEEEISLVDGVVHIPMLGQAESLNAATAASVVLFEVLRQRRFSG